MSKQRGALGWKPAPRKPVTKKSLLPAWRGYLRHLRVQDDRSAVTRDVRSYVVCIDLCQAMIAWLSGKGEPPAEGAILAAMRRPQQDPRFYGALALQALAMFDAEGPDTLMSVFRKATHWACQSIIFQVGRPVRGEVLDRLIGEAARHENPEVRKWAIQYAYHNDIPSFDRLMARRGRLEKDKEALRQIERFVSLRRDGYHAKYSRKERCWEVHFHWGNGRITQDIPKSVVDEVGFREAIECCRAALSLKPPPVPWEEIMKARREAMDDEGSGNADRRAAPTRQSKRKGRGKR